MKQELHQTSQKRAASNAHFTHRIPDETYITYNHTIVLAVELILFFGKNRLGGEGVAQNNTMSSQVLAENSQGTFRISTVQ